MKRSVGVTVIAVLSLLGSIFTLAMGLMMVAIAVFAPKTGAPVPPVFLTVMMGVVSLFYFLFAAWGISSSIGLFRLKNWARISTIVFASLLSILSIFSLPMAFVMPLLTKADTSSDQATRTIVPIVLGTFWAIQLALGIWWLVFLTRARIKAQFVPAATALPPAPMQIEAPVLTIEQSTVPKSSKRPVSITVIACLLLAGCLFIPSNLIMRAPAIFFTKLVFGWPAGLIFIAFAAIQLYVGIGLLRLQPTARLVGLAYFVFGAANSAVFFLAPGAGSRMAGLMEWQKSFLMFRHLSAMPPEFNFDFTQFYRVFAVIGGVGGLIGMAVQMCFLITRKAAFVRSATLI